MASTTASKAKACGVSRGEITTASKAKACGVSRGESYHHIRGEKPRSKSRIRLLPQPWKEYGRKTQKGTTATRKGVSREKS